MHIPLHYRLFNKQNTHTVAVGLASIMDGRDSLLEGSRKFPKNFSRPHAFVSWKSTTMNLWIRTVYKEFGVKVVRKIGSIVSDLGFMHRIRYKTGPEKVDNDMGVAGHNALVDLQRDLCPKLL